ncbi:MAG: hypothetical protein HOF84_02225 [Rhodospirillales bacterium]|nr:hypothetical protein [Rhodospirillales bacterium]MBT7485642.1 hypothetical protein [Rhodospirillales bacterium]
MTQSSSSPSNQSADFDIGLDAYEISDFEAALDKWMPLAEQGNVDAQT